MPMRPSGSLMTPGTGWTLLYLVATELKPGKWHNVFTPGPCVSTTVWSIISFRGSHGRGQGQWLQPPPRSRRHPQVLLSENNRDRPLRIEKRDALVSI